MTRIPLAEEIAIRRQRVRARTRRDPLDRAPGFWLRAQEMRRWSQDRRPETNQEKP